MADARSDGGTTPKTPGSHRAATFRRTCSLSASERREAYHLRSQNRTRERTLARKRQLMYHTNAGVAKKYYSTDEVVAIGNEFVSTCHSVGDRLTAHTLSAMSTSPGTACDSFLNVIDVMHTLLGPTEAVKEVLHVEEDRFNEMINMGVVDGLLTCVKTLTAVGVHIASRELSGSPPAAGTICPAGVSATSALLKEIMWFAELILWCVLDISGGQCVYIKQMGVEIAPVLTAILRAQRHTVPTGAVPPAASEPFLLDVWVPILFKLTMSQSSVDVGVDASKSVPAVEPSIQRLQMLSLWVLGILAIDLREELASTDVVDMALYIINRELNSQGPYLTTAAAGVLCKALWLLEKFLHPATKHVYAENYVGAQSSCHDDTLNSSTRLTCLISVICRVIHMSALPCRVIANSDGTDESQTVPTVCYLRPTEDRRGLGSEALWCSVAIVASFQTSPEIDMLTKTTCLTSLWTLVRSALTQSANERINTESNNEDKDVTITGLTGDSRNTGVPTSSSAVDPSLGSHDLSSDYEKIVRLHGIDILIPAVRVMSGICEAPSPDPHSLLLASVRAHSVITSINNSQSQAASHSNAGQITQSADSLQHTLTELLQSPHRGVVEETAIFIGQLASGSDEHVDAVMPLVPIMAQILNSPQNFDIKRDVAIAFLHMALNHSSRHMDAVLSATPSVLDSFLNLFENARFDKTTVLVALDFVEGVMHYRPQYRPILLDQGAIEKLEMPQYDHDEIVSRRISYVVQNYFDSVDPE